MKKSKIKPLYAEITAAIHDMNGFAPLGRITVEQYEAAEEIPKPADDVQVVYLLDLWDKDGTFDDKIVSRETAAALAGLDPLAIEQVARQRLAQINDEDSEYMKQRATVRAALAGWPTDNLRPV